MIAIPFFGLSTPFGLLSDRFGHHHPWVELYNGGTNAIDLGGYFLAGNYSNLTQWPFPPGTTISPTQFLVVWLDGNTVEMPVEQAAFSELQLDAPVSMTKLGQMMANVDGYKVVRPDLQKTTALAEGWVLKAPVAGFKPMSCFKRVVSQSEGALSESAMQWIFSDGLASVSLFVEAYDRQRHTQEGTMSIGATKSMTRRLSDRSADKPGEWWLTVVGEVPTQTLHSFVQGLERKR